MGSMSRKPVVLQMIPNLGAGGAEQGCIDIAAELVRAGAIAHVISNGGPRMPDLTRTGATHHQWPVHNKNPFVMWSMVGRLRKFIMEQQVDIVHVRSRVPAWIAYQACKGTRAHFMTTMHAPYPAKSKLKKWYNSVMARGERVIAISDYVGHYAQSTYDVPDSRLRIIHRGIDFNKFSPAAVSAERMMKLSREWRLPDGAPVIFCPARLTRWKGQVEFLKAFKQLNRPDVMAVIAGDDQGRAQYRDELVALSRALELDGQVRIVPQCKDMAAAYRLAAVVACPSIEPEGFGRVPVEAQAMGRPIVATDHGGARETVLNGTTGWLVTPGDVDALAGGLASAIDVGVRDNMVFSMEARAWVESKFTLDKMCADTLNVYIELLRHD